MCVRFPSPLVVQLRASQVINVKEVASKLVVCVGLPWHVSGVRGLWGREVVACAERRACWLAEVMLVGLLDVDHDRVESVFVEDWSPLDPGGTKVVDDRG